MPVMNWERFGPDRRPFRVKIISAVPVPGMGSAPVRFEEGEPAVPDPRHRPYWEAQYADWVRQQEARWESSYGEWLLTQGDG